MKLCLRLSVCQLTGGRRLLLYQLKKFIKIFVQIIIIIIIIIIIFFFFIPLVVKIPGVKRKKLKTDVSSLEWSEV